MHYVGIDLHKRTVVVALENDKGPVGKPRTFPTRDTVAILEFFDKLDAFCAVIEASSSYRWLYDLLITRGRVCLAHPFRLRAIVSGRAKTDKLDAQLLAKLLRAGLIPESYVPPVSYQQLRELTRGRSRLVREATHVKNQLHRLLAQRNIHSPYKNPFCKRGLKWIQGLQLSPVDQLIKQEHLRRLEHYKGELDAFDDQIEQMCEVFPEVKALTDLHGVGLYTALLIIGEIGEPWRFSEGKKVGAYAGLTARVSQSGGHCYHGHITRQGSSWLRWALVQVAFKVIKADKKLNSFYTRVRKRSSAHIARVAVARKLATICWVRLMHWHREHQDQTQTG